VPGALQARDRRLDMLNARYFVVSEWDSRYLEFRTQPDRFRLVFTYGDTDVIENLKALPAAFIVPASGIEVISGEDLELGRVKDPGFDPERSVVLPESFADDKTKVVLSSLPQKSGVVWISRRSSDFRLRVEAAQSSVLVISQIYYPGWKAYIDGRAVPVMRADFALSAIPMAQGSHEVRFSFEPLSFRIGAILSALALLAVAALLLQIPLASAWRNRRAGK